MSNDSDSKPYGPGHNHPASVVSPTLGLPCPVPTCPKFMGPIARIPVLPKLSLTESLALDPNSAMKIEVRTFECVQMVERRGRGRYWMWSERT